MWAAIIPVLGTLLDKVLPDANAAADAKLRVLELAQKGELAVLDADVKLAMGQLEVNKIEAADPSLFKSGWRPAVGWICVIGLAYEFLLRNLLPWLFQGFGLESFKALPSLDIEAMMTLLLGLLGLGGLRTYERVKNKA
jgi:hypothetical protein